MLLAIDNKLLLIVSINGSIGNYLWNNIILISIISNSNSNRWNGYVGIVILQVNTAHTFQQLEKNTLDIWENRWLSTTRYAWSGKSWRNKLISQNSGEDQFHSKEFSLCGKWSIGLTKMRAKNWSYLINPLGPTGTRKRSNLLALFVSKHIWGNSAS